MYTVIVGIMGKITATRAHVSCGFPAEARFLNSLVALFKLEYPDSLIGVEKVPHPLFVTQEPIYDSPSRANNLAGNQDEGMQKTAKLHPQYLSAPDPVWHQ